MLSLSRSDRLFAISLSALAGYVDAIGFIATGGYFLSFMSGNSTRLAVGLEHGLAFVWSPLGLVVSFLAGVVLGTAVGRRAGRRRACALLLLIAALLTLAIASFQGGAPLVGFAFAAMAMGAENTIYEADGEVRVGLTYMTGTLVKVGQRLHDWLAGGSARGWIGYIALWAGLVAGAIGGAFAFSSWSFDSLWLAVGLAILLAYLSMARGLGDAEPSQDNRSR